VNCGRRRRSAVYRWDIDTAKEVGRLLARKTSNPTLASLPDGRTLATLDDNLAVVLMDTATGRNGSIHEASAAACLGEFADGGRLAPGRSHRRFLRADDRSLHPHLGGRHGQGSAGDQHPRGYSARLLAMRPSRLA
jgi:hypothetical protein